MFEENQSKPKRLSFCNSERSGVRADPLTRFAPAGSNRCGRPPARATRPLKTAPLSRQTGVEKLSPGKRDSRLKFDRERLRIY